HGKLRVKVVAIIVGAKAIGAGGIVVRNRGQRAEQYFTFGAGALALDEQDQAVELILNIFRLGEMQGFARSTNDGDRTRPAAGQKRKLAHGLSLRAGAV